MDRDSGLENQRRQRPNREAFVDILRFISNYGQFGGIQIPKLMYLCYVEHSRLKDFLASLTEKKLLCYYEKTRRYKITQKGMRFLKNYKPVGGLLNAT
jgi:predicted transcriptional regulator